MLQRGERPDYDRICDTVTYLREQGDTKHHPREDAAFAILVKRCPDLALPIARLQQERTLYDQLLARALRRFPVMVLTGFYNVPQLGSLAQVMESGAGLALAGKFILVLVAVAIAAQRDFAHVSRLSRIASDPEEAASALRVIAWLDRFVLVFAIVIIYLGLFVSRGH